MLLEELLQTTSAELENLQTLDFNDQSFADLSS
jgi:hypothetical protein